MFCFVVSEWSQIRVWFCERAFWCLWLSINLLTWKFCLYCISVSDKHIVVLVPCHNIRIWYIGSINDDCCITGTCFEQDCLVHVTHLPKFNEGTCVFLFPMFKSVMLVAKFQAIFCFLLIHLLIIELFCVMRLGFVGFLQQGITFLCYWTLSLYSYTWNRAPFLTSCIKIMWTHLTTVLRT
jgi:hypothetical protein